MRANILHNVSTKQLVFILGIVSFLWTYMLLNVTRNETRTSVQLKTDILKLSEKYVNALAREHKDVVDGPYSGRLTGYDLKKTMAVLLQSMLERISALEGIVRNRTAWSLNATRLRGAALTKLHKVVGESDKSASAVDPGDNYGQQPSSNNIAVPRIGGRRLPQDFVDFASLIRGVQDSCELPPESKARFPECDGKIDWMKKHWRTDSCYSKYGVDGSECTIIIYLSEIESFCPKLPIRIAQHLNYTHDGKPPATMNRDLDGLLSLLSEPSSGRPTYDWVKQRIRRLWPRWLRAAQYLHAKNMLPNQRGRRKIVVHLGLVTHRAGLHIAEDAFSGGPLGELIQWSDLIAALYILGHDVIVTSEQEDLKKILESFPSAKSQCQARKTLMIDAFFTDLVGVNQFRYIMGASYSKFSCLLRVLDTFGTEPKFNFAPYARKMHLKTTWGKKNLMPKQFYTFYPHTSDNSFMGFVVDLVGNKSSLGGIKRENIALIYAKHSYQQYANNFFQNAKPYLDVLKETFSIHATLPKNVKLPSYVINHGVLPSHDFQVLLRRTRVFVGLGFPYDGPAALEAIGNGAVFLNPMFKPAHGRGAGHAAFFRDKPTQRLDDPGDDAVSKMSSTSLKELQKSVIDTWLLRWARINDYTLTSQHPYIEHNLGEPYSYLVDMNDPEQIRKTVRRIMSSKPPGDMLPFEFTPAGFLQRISVFTEHHDFCDKERPLWPPATAVMFYLGVAGDSCATTCWKKNQICEPAHFETINKRVELQDRGITCDNIEFDEDLYYPAYSPGNKKCIFQGQPMLFSCVDRKPDLMRFCPCRDYIKHQSELCARCI